MGPIIINFVVTFIMMYCEGIAGEVINNDTINLEYFQHPFFFNMLHAKHQCRKSCEDITMDDMTIQTDSDIKSSCYGTYNDCQAMVVADTVDLQYCRKNNSTDIVWAFDSQRKVEYGQKSNCGDGATEYTVPRVGYSGGSGCPICVCTCYEATSGMASNKGKWWFSAVPQTSDENKVITGVKFVEINHTIFLQIKQNQFPIDTTGNWKTLDEEVEAEEGVSKDTRLLLTDKRRSLMLDEFELPDGYVITGVKFEEATIPATSQLAIRLSVRSTKLTKSKDGLESETSTWIHGTTSKLKSTHLKWLPSSMGLNPDLKTHIMFGIGDLSKDFGKLTEPTISAEPCEATILKETPMGGLQLLLVNISEKQKIYPRVAPLGIDPDPESKEEEDDDDDMGDNGDSASTTNLQFILIALVPLSIIFNLFD